MFGSGRPSLSALAELCHTLRHYLGGGLTVLDAFRREASKGRAVLRPLAARVVERLEAGADLGDALKAEGDRLPPLFVSLVRVGEHTGMLPEIFGDLEKHFTRLLQLRREFFQRIAWPVIQFTLAVLVIAGLIWILGEIGSRPGAVPYDPLGLGLSGFSGAMIFLGVVCGTLGGLFGLWLLLSRLLRQKAAVDAFLLRVPLLGPCSRALALGRFCLALRLTTEAGMPIREALRLSLAATGNAAFIVAGDRVDASVRSGKDLTRSLARTGLLPDDFVHMLDVAEESGRLEEVLRHQSEHYDEEASRRMAALTAAAAYGVWMLLGLCIIVAIFRLFTSYLNLLNSLGV
jgi:type IV pilus assembly protein PilC